MATSNVKNEAVLFRTQFAESINDTLQQKVSKLKTYCDLRNLVGGDSLWQATAGLANAQSYKLDYTHTSGSDPKDLATPIQDINFTKRCLVSQPLSFGTIVNNLAELRAGVKLDGLYVRTAVADFQRKIDEMIMFAFTKDVQIDPSSAAAKSSMDKVKFINCGKQVTLSALLKARTYLTRIEQRPLFCACDSYFKEGLLQMTETTSRDYANVLSLVAGTVNTFLDTEFVQLATNLIPKLTLKKDKATIDGIANTPVWEVEKVDRDSEDLKATQIRMIPIFAKDAIMLGTMEELTTYMDRNPDKRYKQHIYAEMDMGAMRAVDELVTILLCGKGIDDETIKHMKIPSGTLGNSIDQIVKLY
jgi:hypothetical protein